MMSRVVHPAQAHKAASAVYKIVCGCIKVRDHGTGHITVCVVICGGAFAGGTHTTFVIQTLFCASTLNDEQRAKLLEMFAIRVGGEDPLSSPKLQVRSSRV